MNKAGFSLTYIFKCLPIKNGACKQWIYYCEKSVVIAFRKRKRSNVSEVSLPDNNIATGCCTCRGVTPMLELWCCPVSGHALTLAPVSSDQV